MKKDLFAWIALLLLFAFHLINNMAIIFRDTTPFMADASNYYKTSFLYWKTWADFVKCWDLQVLAPIRCAGLGGELPALLAVPFFSVFGVSHDTAILANQSFFLILILSMFGLGKTLFDRKTGLWAAFLVSFYPGVIGFSRVYMLEFPILAVSTACVYLLIKSEGFKNFKYSLCFGFAFALGELIRPRFAVYIVIPVLLYAIKNITALFKQTEAPVLLQVKKMVINVFSSTILSCLVLSPWYSMNQLSEYLKVQKLWLSWPALSKIVPTLPDYLRMLGGTSLGWFFTFLFFLGLAISLFAKNKRPKIYFLLVWFALTLIFLSMFGLKDFPWHVIPLLAPVALLSSAGFEGLSKPKIGKYLAVVFLFFSVFQYFLISYGGQCVDRKNSRRRLASVCMQGLLQAQTYDWALDELMATFEERRNSDEAWSWRFINQNVRYLKGGRSSPAPDDPVKVLNIHHRGTPIHNEIEERIFIENLPVVVMGLYTDQFDWKMLFSDTELQHMVLGADYVMRSKGKWPEGGFIDTVLDIFEANIARFDKLKTVKTPGGEISIYGRKNEFLKSEKIAQKEEGA